MKLFFSYDEENGIRFHDTDKDAKAGAEESLDAYGFGAESDGWNDAVATVCWGEVKQSATKTNVHAPDPEEGENPDFDEICDYVLLPELVEPPARVLTSDCECKNWATIDHRHGFLTGHHVNCPKSPNALECAYKLIAALCAGIEDWGSEEDGVPDFLWESYRTAKALEGVFVDKEAKGCEA